MELTEIYLNEVSEISKNVPFTPFTLNVPDSLQNDLDMPQSRYLNRKRKSVANVSELYGDMMKEKLYEVIPYADKKEIIKSILFLQTINQTIK